MEEAWDVLDWRGLGCAGIVIILALPSRFWTGQGRTRANALDESEMWHFDRHASLRRGEGHGKFEKHEGCCYTFACVYVFVLYTWPCASRRFCLVVGCGKHFFERLRKTRSVGGKQVPAYIIGPALEGQHPGLPLFFKALRAMTTSPKLYWINLLVEKHGHPSQQDALRYDLILSWFFWLSFYFGFFATNNPVRDSNPSAIRKNKAGCRLPTAYLMPCFFELH